MCKKVYLCKLVCNFTKNDIVHEYFSRILNFKIPFFLELFLLATPDFGKWNRKISKNNIIFIWRQNKLVRICSVFLMTFLNSTVVTKVLLSWKNLYSTYLQNILIKSHDLKYSSTDFLLSLLIFCNKFYKHEVLCLLCFHQSAVIELNKILLSKLQQRRI